MGNHYAIEQAAVRWQSSLKLLNALVFGHA